MKSPEFVVATCLLAQDGNRPFLMRRVFARNAEVEVHLRTDAAPFPSDVSGLAAIEDALCRRFAADFENVYTFALARPAANNRRHFPCHWLMGMTERVSGKVHVGCGRHDWRFATDPDCLVERLVIGVEVMQDLPAGDLPAVVGWLAGLPYPWSTPGGAIAGMPALAALGPVTDYLRTAHSIPPDR
jgi:hypothetical protein